MDDRRGGYVFAMKRAQMLAAVCGLLAFAGCGGEERFSENRILEAAKVEEGEGGELGAVEGDPFCGVDAVLTSATAIDETPERQPIVTSKQGNVGVVVVLPFPNDCEETVRKGLNKLDPKEED
jgi:hypothetical protein